MKQTDVIIIGAGATGLMAAYTLARAGKTVTVLEARNRIGGRIHTINDKNFSAPTELGAEFIHGNLPVTLALLKEAGISIDDVLFEMWQNHNGIFTQSDEFVEGWDEFLKKANQLEYDMPLHDFLDQNFAADDYAKTRSQVENYVAGYDTADTHDASTFALRNEWNHEDEDAQHRVDGGYITLLDYLASVCRELGNEIVLNAVAKEIQWSGTNVKVTAGNTLYEAEKIIIALPLGVLKASEDAVGSIKFNPPLADHTEALKDMGFGSVIKILLEFDTIFWESDTVTKQIGTDLSTMGFLFADEAVPTFWTQAPLHSPLLTGWLGGIPAYELKDVSAEDILQLTLTSLKNIFKIDTEILKNKLIAWHVANWTAEPYTRGSYAYDTVKSPAARKILQQPVNNTIYFAGEYLYNGPAMGTVEAAMTSGKTAAEKLLKSIE